MSGKRCEYLAGYHLDRKCACGPDVVRCTYYENMEICPNYRAKDTKGISKLVKSGSREKLRKDMKSQVDEFIDRITEDHHGYLTFTTRGCKLTKVEDLKTIRMDG